MQGQVLTVTLNPAVDKIIKVKNFSLGQEDQRINNVVLSAGGKGINVARALKHLGLKSVSTGFLAGSTGHFIKEELKKENLCGDFLNVAGETRTNLTIIDSSKKKTTRILEGGPRISSKDLTRFKKKYIQLLSGCRWVVFSGSIAPGLPNNIFSQLIAIAKYKGIKTALDTSGEPLKSGLRATPFFIKPNLEEAESVVGYRLNSPARIKKAVLYFHELGIRLVVISLGEKGAVVSDGKEILQASPPQLQYKSNVGCGDAFVAGFIDAYERTNDFREALRFAAACGAANTQTLQPGAIQKKTVQHLNHRVVVKQVG